MSSRSWGCFVREMDAPEALKRLQHLHSQLKNAIARRFHHAHHAKFLHFFIQRIEHFHHSSKPRLNRRPKQRPKAANSNRFGSSPNRMPQSIASKNFDRNANQNPRRPSPLHPRRRCAHQSLQFHSPTQINSAHNSEPNPKVQAHPSTPGPRRTAGAPVPPASLPAPLTFRPRFSARPSHAISPRVPVPLASRRLF